MRTEKKLFLLALHTHWGFLKSIIPIVRLQKKALIIRPSAHTHRKGKSQAD